MVEDYYAVLGIPRTADGATITSQYRRLALQTHPDKNRFDPNATTNFQLVATAYETLKDPSRRRAYDSKCVTEATSNPFHSSTPASRKPPTSCMNCYTSPWGRKIDELQTKLEELEDRHSSLWEGRDYVRPHITATQKAIEQLDAEVVEDDMQEKSAKTWFARLFRAKESKELMVCIARRRTERATGRLVLEARRNYLNNKFDVLDRAIKETRREICDVKDQVSEAKRSEAKWLAQEDYREQIERLRQRADELERFRYQRAKEWRKEKDEKRAARMKKHGAQRSEAEVPRQTQTEHQ
ncbi:uncharacterized protein JN550_011126 [Neoarthrinium moseri]|uniref:uncharacterized protein n=1 Tax=Neoarthrinium moseri TaxID=1658444 RepID=UPI001FDCAB0A|nr:uncharacterized protein JN550_011126 [Neoarthrinium moseri]KAI1860971.1 hypothetical protein JN550_011126 [Neoarthrinium moseri]